MRLPSLSFAVLAACAAGPLPAEPDAAIHADAAPAEPDGPASATDIIGWLEPLRDPVVVPGGLLGLAIEVPSGVTAAGLGFVANEPSGEVWIGLYRAPAGAPTELVAQASSVALSAGPMTLGIPATPLAPGTYALVMRSNSDAVTLMGTAATPTRSCEGLDAGPAGPLPATFSATQCTLDTSVWNVYLAPQGAAPRPPEARPDRQLPAEAPGPIGEHLGGVGILAIPIVLAEAATLAEVGVVAHRDGGRYRIALYDTDAAGQPARFVAGTILPRLARAGENVVDIVDRPLPAGRYQLALWSDDLEIAADASVSVPRCARSIVIRGTEPWPSRYGDAVCAGGAAPRVFIRLAPPR